MAVVNLEETSFANYLQKPIQKFILDLSNSNVVEVLNEYQTFKRKSNPNFSLHSLIYNIEKLQRNFGIELQPLQITDDFYVHFFAFLVNQGIMPSSIKTYFVILRAAFNWAVRHNLSVAPTYDQFDIPSYEKTKVVLTPDEVAMIAHFNIREAMLPKDKEFFERAKAMLPKDIERVKKCHAKAIQKKIKMANKKYATAVNKAEKDLRERLSRENVSSYKKNKAKVLYRTTIANIKNKLNETILKLEHSNIDINEKAIIEERIQKLKNKAMFSRESNIKNLERVRDQFILQCNLGQRYSDIIRVTNDCFSKNHEIFSIVQQKTGRKAVVNIPTFCFDKRVIYDILERYNYTSPYPHDIGNFN